MCGRNMPKVMWCSAPTGSGKGRVVGWEGYPEEVSMLRPSGQGGARLVEKMGKDHSRQQVLYTPGS